MFDNNISIKTNNQINDNSHKPKIKTEQSQPIDVIDPTKVTKTTKNDQSNMTEQNLFSYNPDSVYDKFIKSLKTSPVLSESARKFLLNKQFINNNIKSDNVLAALFENFLKSIDMNDGQILEFLKFQHENYTKFNGDFFKNLRALLKEYPNNEDFKIIIRNFLRSYDCLLSANETNKSINAALENIERYMPDMLKKPFSEITEKIVSNDGKAYDLNLNILKNEILPFIGRYISKMNDFGPVRDYVSLLIHNMVRLETGLLHNFSNDLDNLLDYVKYNFDVDDKYMENLKISLIRNYDTASNVKNEFSESIQAFLKILESGVKESDNLVNNGLMEDMTKSLLFNQNIHLPLMHLFLPLSYKGMYMFSELWIGKEYEEFTDNKKSQ
ncbi:MAG: hypothetical protein PHT02_12310, partial [Tissierellia bacterium]|nr:hypothetical protein [Tissierellia bacterium]